MLHVTREIINISYVRRNTKVETCVYFFRSLQYYELEQKLNSKIK